MEHGRAVVVRASAPRYLETSFDEALDFVRDHPFVWAWCRKYRLALADGHDSHALP